MNRNYKPSIWRYLLAVFFLCVLSGEIYGVLSSKRDRCYVEQSMYLDETFIYDTYYIFDESAADIYGRTFSLQYDLSIVPHYNCYHIYGEIRIDDQLYPCDYWTLYPNTPLAECVSGFSELIHFFKSGYFEEGSSYTKSPIMDIELADGYQLHMNTQGGYAPAISIRKSDGKGEARYRSRDYSDYLKQYYEEEYQTKKYTDTQSVPHVITPITANLSEITELRYSLYEVTPALHATTEYACSRVPSTFTEQYYPLTDGCWAHIYSSFYALNAERKYALPVAHVLQIIHPDGSVPGTGKRGIALYQTTVALAFDTGDLLICEDLHRKYLNGETNEYLSSEKMWVTGELLRGNRFSRISRYTRIMSNRYTTGPFVPDSYPMSFALFDRTTRLTDYKYCELYASGEVFVGLYFDENDELYTDILDETGTILHTEAGNLRGEYPEEANNYGSDGLTVMQDAISGLYYYANAAGKAVCEPTFTECTTIKNGTAVVLIGETRYMLVVTEIN